jgi:hypothetical protein
MFAWNSSDLLITERAGGDSMLPACILISSDRKLMKAGIDETCVYETSFFEAGVF